mmetsp:Transcript_122473/g.305836  ORF Transcript_122473/g.305836 Transcript_122473/m.305836 type:complete len:202 (+) Transcript_122473:2067-2672(+)
MAQLLGWLVKVQLRLLDKPHGILVARAHGPSVDQQQQQHKGHGQEPREDGQRNAMSAEDEGARHAAVAAIHEGLDLVRTTTDGRVVVPRIAGSVREGRRCNSDLIAVDPAQAHCGPLLGLKDRGVADGPIPALAVHNLREADLTACASKRNIVQLPLQCLAPLQGVEPRHHSGGVRLCESPEGEEHGRDRVDELNMVHEER